MVFGRSHRHAHTHAIFDTGNGDRDSLFITCGSFWVFPIEEAADCSKALSTLTPINGHLHAQKLCPAWPAFSHSIIIHAIRYACSHRCPATCPASLPARAHNLVRDCMFTSDCHPKNVQESNHSGVNIYRAVWSFQGTQSNPHRGVLTTAMIYDFTTQIRSITEKQIQKLFSTKVLQRRPFHT